MPETNHPRPRWWPLYLSLPLLGVLFWLIEQAHPTDVVRRSLEIGAVLIIFGYIELWRLANAVALLHYPLDGREGRALYRVSEVAPLGDRDLVDGHRPAPAYTFYSDLFTVPVCIAEPPLLMIDEGPRERSDE